MYELPEKYLLNSVNENPKKNFGQCFFASFIAAAILVIKKIPDNLSLKDVYDIIRICKEKELFPYIDNSLHDKLSSIKNTNYFIKKKNTKRLFPIIIQ